MSATQEMAEQQAAADDIHETANDRFKRSTTSWFSSAVIAATVIHFLAFQFAPNMQAEDVASISDSTVVLPPPPEIEIPPPPEKITRPATPVVSTTMLDETVTITETTFEEVSTETALPPPELPTGGDDGGSGIIFTHAEQMPEIKNRAEVVKALQREYPPTLRDAGMGGVVTLAIQIGLKGEILDVRIHASSNSKMLDDAAMRVAKVIKYSPAINNHSPVQVWIAQPIRFTTDKK